MYLKWGVDLGAIFKRIFDFLAALIGGLLISPLLLYVVYRIKKDSPGPAIYDGERIGENGKLFKCYKFRSMINDSEWILEEYLANNPKEKEQWDKYKKLDHDPRVTPFGDKIRRASIDELPQLWNVLVGDMSLVGPRPYLPREIDDMGEYYKTIIKVKPGITGWWQVHGRSNTDFETRLLMDQWYEKKRNFLLDMIILWETIGVVIMKKGSK